MALNDTFVRAVKADAKPRKHSDGGGLYLFVPISGSKLWRQAYNYGGKQRALSHGQYPAVSLAAARKARDAAKELLAQGIDPGRQKRLAKIKIADDSENTFSAVAADLRTKLVAEGKADRTVQRYDYLIGRANADIGNLPVASISAAEILAVVRKQEKRGKLASAAKLRTTVGQVIRYAIATGKAENDPTIALKGAIATRKVVHRPAIRDRAGFGRLLRLIWAYPSVETARGLQLLALLYCRPGELQQARWSEFDLDGAVWAIPAERMKGRKEHRKPLARQAVAILRDQQEVAGQGDYVFPSARSWRRPISNAAWLVALRAMGIRQDEHVPHGFRGSASSLLNECGRWNPDAIEREQAHVDSNEIRRAYARSDFWEERIRMAQWWADEIDAMRDGADVVALRSA